MTATQLKKWIERHGYTQVALCAALGISERNFRRYTSGELPVPKMLTIALRAIELELKV